MVLVDYHKRINLNKCILRHCRVLYTKYCLSDNRRASSLTRITQQKSSNILRIAVYASHSTSCYGCPSPRKVAEYVRHVFLCHLLKAIQKCKRRLGKRKGNCRQEKGRLLQQAPKRKSHVLHLDTTHEQEYAHCWLFRDTTYLSLYSVGG